MIHAHTRNRSARHVHAYSAEGWHKITVSLNMRAMNLPKRYWQTAWLTKLYFSFNINVYQYNETNVMHFSFNLLRIKASTFFEHYITHPQEALNKRRLVYCIRIMSVGCVTIATLLQTCHSELTLYQRTIPNAVCVAPAEDEQVMLETCRGLVSQ
jgi:hypothetical protein